eukprot:scaffold182631_cov19-Tisochrysis_lutea.AAC.1
MFAQVLVEQALKQSAAPGPPPQRGCSGASMRSSFPRHFRTCSPWMLRAPQAATCSDMLPWITWMLLHALACPPANVHTRMLH